MPLSVRNNEVNTTVFTKTVAGEPVRITWGAKGQPNDTQRVPNSFADDIDFLNALEQGVFEVVDGPPEILSQINQETAKARRLREETLARQAAAAESVMDRVQDKSMVGATCIGPGVRPGQVCGAQLLIAHKNVNDVPPLCGSHADLAPTFSLLETGSKGEGATESRDGVVRREWRQAVLTPSRPGL